MLYVLFIGLVFSFLNKHSYINNMNMDGIIIQSLSTIPYNLFKTDICFQGGDYYNE